MWKRFLCCKKKVNNNINNNINKNISNIIMEDISVLVTTDSRPSIGELDSLKMVEWKDTVEFIPPIDRGVVIKVYDGDTITIASKLPYADSPLYRFSVRLNGIDCPEIKGKDIYEKECAQLAKLELSILILNKMVTLKNVQTEKYGRILAEVYFGELNINKYMLEKRLAVVYNGGTKISPSNWMNYYIKGELH